MAIKGGQVIDKIVAALEKNPVALIKQISHDIGHSEPVIRKTIYVHGITLQQLRQEAVDKLIADRDKYEHFYLDQQLK